MKSNILLVLCILFLSACSTYKTNSDQRFGSTDTRYERPSIYVGELAYDPSEYSYIGSIDIEVRKPNPFANKPTEAMADITLAHVAKKQGAHAVTFVKYKRKLTGGLEATGQAIRFKKKSDFDTVQQRVLSAEKRAKQSAAQTNFGEINSDAIEPFTDEAALSFAPAPAPAPAPAQIDSAPESAPSESISSQDNGGVAIPRGEYTQVLTALYQLREQAKKDKDLARYQQLVDIIAKLEFFQ